MSRPGEASTTRGGVFDWLILGGFAVSLPLLAYAVLHVRSDTSSVSRWLPIGTEERVNYDRFVELFGSDQFLLVSWDGCTPVDPRLEKFATSLRLSAGRSSGGTPPLVARVVTTSDLIGLLRAPPLSLSDREARRRLTGFLLGEGDHAAVLIEAGAEGAARQKELVDAVYAIAKSVVSVPADDLYIGGSIFEAVAIDRESFQSLKLFIIPSALAVLILALATVRDVRLVAIMLVVAVYCQMASVAVVHFSGASLDAVLIIMPTLVYVTTMSSMLHLAGYYRHALAQGVEDPAKWSLKHGWRPCAGASLTTAIGLASLAVSQVEPVRMFGIFASLGVTIALAVTLLAAPSAFRALHHARRRVLEASGARVSIAGRGYQQWVARWHRWIILVWLLVMVGTGWGVVQLKSSLNLQQMFPPESSLVRNYRWLEDHVGPLISIEVLVAFPRDGGVDKLRQLECLQAIDACVRQQPEVESTTSVLTFVPPLSRSGSLRAVAHRAMLRRYLDDHRDQLTTERVMAVDGSSDVWRITARISAIAGLEYGDVAASVAHRVEALRQRLPTDIRETVALTFTGLTPIVYRAQDQILADLFNSFLGAFVLITPLMMLNVRSVSGGLIAMLPNVAPVLIAFGILGWTGTAVNIGVVLTASVGLGIAVDGTLHFVGWYQQRLRAGDDPAAALTDAVQTCTPALVQATLIVGLGLLVYALSDFIPTRRFTWLLLLLLVVALAADLVLMPALLMSAVGRLFNPRSLRSSDGRPPGTST